MNVFHNSTTTLKLVFVRHSNILAVEVTPTVSNRKNSVTDNVESSAESVSLLIIINICL